MLLGKQSHKSCIEAAVFHTKILVLDSWIGYTHHGLFLIYL